MYHGIVMPLSDTVKQQVVSILSAFCDKRVPADIRGEVNLTCTFRGNSVTLYENRPQWLNRSQWIHMPIAQFRLNPRNGEWTLYCADRNLRWHEYPEIAPTSHFDALLAEVDKDPTGIFFG